MTVWKILSLDFLSEWVLDFERRWITELKFACTLKMSVSALPLDKFWISVQAENPATYREIVNILLWFQLLSFMSIFYLTSIKNKECSFLLTVDNEIHVRLSHISDPELHILQQKTSTGFILHMYISFFFCSNNFLIQI